MSYSEINPKLSFNKSQPSDTRSFSRYQENNNNYTPDEYYQSGLSTLALHGTLEDNDVSRLFFSNENVKRLQNKIKREIYNRTEGKYKIEVDQDINELTIVMRAMYFEYSKNLPRHIVTQVKRLNELVVEHVVPDMITNIKQYFGYLRDINEPLKPISRPINVNNAGRRSLPSVTSTWGF